LLWPSARVLTSRAGVVWRAGRRHGQSTTAPSDVPWRRVAIKRRRFTVTLARFLCPDKERDPFALAQCAASSGVGRATRRRLPWHAEVSVVDEGAVRLLQIATVNTSVEQSSEKEYTIFERKTERKHRSVVKSIYCARRSKVPLAKWRWWRWCSHVLQWLRMPARGAQVAPPSCTATGTPSSSYPSRRPQSPVPSAVLARVLTTSKPSSRFSIGNSSWNLLDLVVVQQQAISEIMYNLEDCYHQVAS
jgi:hypothetical protein